METNSLRKSLRLWLEGLTKSQTELESLNTKENQELMLQYPIKDGEWRHPQSHILERTLYFMDQARKCAQKMVDALPRERKPKNAKKVDWDGKELNKKEKKREKRSKTSPPEPKTRETGKKAGNGGDGNKRSKAKVGVAPVPQERKKRGRPKKS